MKRALLIFTILFVSSLANFHKGIKKPKPKFYGKFVKNKYKFFKRERESISHSYSEIAKRVNNMKTTWKATTYKRDYTPLLGAYLNEVIPLPEKKFSKKKLNLPESFDAREEYPKCESIKEVRDQANCGSCWAFGAVEAMSDRICIHSGQTLQTRVSAQHLLSCCTSCGFGCDGGMPSAAWKYWLLGITTGDLYGDTQYCQPYFLPPCDHHIDGSHGACPATVDTPECVSDCSKGNKEPISTQMTYGTSAYSVSGEDNMMQEIYENGPVEGSFLVYEDFVTYKSGVYQHVTGEYLGGHAIKIIGWGVENGVKYWLCVNSWNDEWGDKGLFKILRGTNDCGIENNAYAGMPKL